MVIRMRFCLQSGRIGVMDVVATTAQGENTVNDIPDQPANTEATPAAEPSPTKRPRGRRQTRQVALAKGSPGKKAHLGAKAEKPAKNGKRARQGSKTAKVLDLLKRPTGATGADLMPYASHCTSPG
jgi:hypothetical protein